MKSIRINVWQIATGDPGRDYSSIFFDHDVMFIGPSDEGSAIDNPDKYRDGKPNSAKNQVYNFTFKPTSGDYILMRYTNDVVAVGIVPSEPENQYSFQPEFECVYGWDLCHTRRVIWTKENIPEIVKNIFSNRSQQPSFTGVLDEKVKQALSNFNTEVFNRPLKALPTIDFKKFTDDELGMELFRKGISNKNVEDIIKALNQANRLINWYWSADKQAGRYPSENEVISHIILPIFLGLGWSHQQIAVEWKKVDVAFFKRTPTLEQNCVMVLEAKGLGSPLGVVIDQPIYYIKKHSLNNAKLIIVTDGANIFVYRVNKGIIKTIPIGYFNLYYLQHEYILPKNINVINTLVNLQPAMI